MNSIVKSAQSSHAAKFQRLLLDAETEYFRTCGVFGHESAEAKAAWHIWQGMKRSFRMHAHGSAPSLV